MSKQLCMFLGLSVMIAGAASAKAPEWSYGNEKENFTMTIRSSACYQDDELANISLNWYGTANGVTVSADASCDCGEAMQINGNLLITPSSFAVLVTDGLPVEFTGYMCLPADPKG